MTGIPTFPPERGRCRETCGLGDAAPYSSNPGRYMNHHRCLLALGHEGRAEFIATCTVNRGLPILPPRPAEEGYA